MSYVRKHWRKHAKTESDFRVPPIVCKDGFRMSVQASSAHCCSPRQFVKSGEYTAWEVGYPSAKEPELMKWAEDADNPTSTVYGFVPTNVIDAVIAKHGGPA